RPPVPPSYLAVSSIRDLPASGTAAAPVAIAPPANEAAGAAITRLSALHTRSASAVGDSVMLGSAQALRELVPKLTIDAEVGRQPAAAVATVRDLSSAGELGDAVIVHVGNNGPFDAQEFNDLLDALGNTRRVLVVNLRVPRPWESANNEVLVAGIRRHPRAELVDWHSASAGHPEFFRDDGVHLVPAGARVYTTMIALQLYTDDLVTFFAGR
ncbi:MAG: acetyltransferase, partial [Actinomycetota bacterium]|nr:acetyltransferase [Actinomycetota bacterium]